MEIEQFDLQLTKTSVGGGPTVPPIAQTSIPQSEKSSAGAGVESGPAALKNSKQIKIKKVPDKKPAMVGPENLKVAKSVAEAADVAGKFVTVPFKDLPTPQVNFAARLPADFVWPKNLDAASMEDCMSKIDDPVLRMLVEGCWLDLVGAQLECGLRIVALRRGIVLLAIKAETPTREFEIAAKQFYPSLADRTGRDSMAKARSFLKKADPGYSSHEVVKDYASFRNKWTLTKIMEYERRKAEIAGAGELPEGGAGEKEDGNSAPPEKIERSPFVRLETFSTHLRRLAKAFNKGLTSARRLKPDDFQKAFLLIENILPAELQLSVKKIIESRQTAANPKGTKTTGGLL